MNNKKDLNEKLFDVILDEALDLYTIDLVNEEHNPDMTDDEIQTMLNQKNRIYKNVIRSVNASSKPRHRFRAKKIILIAAVIIILTAMATNTSAIKGFIFQIYTYINGNTLNMGTQQTGEFSYDQISVFENKKDIIIPGRLPSNIELSDITDKPYWIKLRYESDEKWVTLSESVVSNEDMGREIEIENNTYFLKECDVLGMRAQILKMQTENEQEILLCSWCSDNIIYELSTNCSELELNEILSNLEYLYK